MERKPARAPRRSVREVTPAAPADQGATIGDIQRELGPRIALMRRRAALTLEQLAAKTGFTKGYLSRIENSRVIPPIATLVRVASVLGLGVADLFAPSTKDAQDDRVCFIKRQEQQSLVRGGSSFGYDYFALASRRNGKRMTPFIMIFPETIDKDIRFDHEGEEFLYLLEGRVAFDLLVDGRPQFFILEPGDSLYFDSTLPHHGRSLRGQSRALIVVVGSAS
ncbi:MAG: helix-turn-helix domain-containing protein [Betaproteobacteria bacterium]